jgi:hypothetical protein
MLEALLLLLLLPLLLLLLLSPWSRGVWDRTYTAAWDTTHPRPGRTRYR